MQCSENNCHAEASGRVRTTITVTTPQRETHRTEGVTQPLCTGHQVQHCIEVRGWAGRTFGTSGHVPVTVCAVPLDYEGRMAQARRTRELSEA